MSSAGSVDSEAGVAAHDGGRGHRSRLRGVGEVGTEGVEDLTRDVRATLDRSTRPSARSGDRRAGSRARAARRGCRAAHRPAARHLDRARRSTARHGRTEHRTTPRRELIRDALRRQSDPCLVRQDDPSPPQLRRRPPSQPGASSLDSPRAIAPQNRTRCSRRPAGGRPGERIIGRPACCDAHPLGLPIATPLDRALRRPVEFPGARTPGET